MSSTPLSDAISALLADGQSRVLEDFYRSFLDASVGVSVDGVPASVRGDYQITAQDRVTMVTVRTPDGRRMVKACADPKVFVQKYDHPINAEMPGRGLLEMVLKVPDLDGVLVCSATSFHSVPIGREDVPRVLRLASRGDRAPWWKFW